MSLTSRLIETLCKLPPAETRDVLIERDLRVPMPDGVELLANRYAPRGGGDRPTILIRSPYGRSAIWGLLFCRPFAERGFQVVIQSCRGTFRSGGEFRPFHNEREDGLATVEWLKKQPWFTGQFATFGPSYLGYVQWAIADSAGPEHRAIAAQVTTSEFRSSMYAGESFWLDTALTWTYLVHNQEKNPALLVLGRALAKRAIDRALARLPLSGAEKIITGREVDYYEDWITHSEPGDPWWQSIDHSGRVPHALAPAHLTGGFYDIFLPSTIADYESLRRAGKNPYLTIGPWTHGSPGLTSCMLRESVAWFRAHLLGDRKHLRPLPVRVYLMGADQWRDYPEWPPPGIKTQRWYLQPDRGLSPALPPASEPDHYRYDPDDPTPAAGGSSLSDNSGPMDNRKLEARSDVLTYTSAPLERDLDVIGPITAELLIKSSLEHTDFFVRLCDVAPTGESINLSDGLLRLTKERCPPDADGVRRVKIELWATANRYKRGHRIRVQVSSGAHPRYARNPGSGEPLATATRLLVAEQTVYHAPDRASSIDLPVMA